MKLVPPVPCAASAVRCASSALRSARAYDQIVVEKCNTAENGEIIVALIDDSATVKRFYKENGHIRLQPENDFMDPIIVDDCMILGKVIGLMRWDIS